MMDKSVIRGDYVDLRFIKGRKVCQIVIETPIEAGATIVRAFGTPQPHEGVPVAVARLEGDAVVKPEPKRERTLSQFVALKCQDPVFQKFMQEKYAAPQVTHVDMDMCASLVRTALGIGSRSELDKDDKAADRWERLWSQFRAWELT